MQWNSSVNNGFSSAPAEKLYIKMDSSSDRPTVEKQMADENSLYNEIKKLITIRQSRKALQSKGETEFVYAEKNEYPLAYLRKEGDEKILVIINPADRQVSFRCSYQPQNSIYTFGGNALWNDGEITVPPCHAGYYIVD